MNKKFSYYWSLKYFVRAALILILLVSVKLYAAAPVYCYPNPASLSKHSELVFPEFDPENRYTVRISTVYGVLVWQEVIGQNNWTFKNRYKQLIKPGLYLYHIYDENGYLIEGIRTDAGLIIPSLGKILITY